MSILLGGKCIDSGNSSDAIGEPCGKDGPIVPKRLMGEVDALCYVKFGSLRGNPPRFHPAGPPEVYSASLDTFKQRPPQGITRPMFESPLRKYGMVSHYACLQFIAGHIIGSDKCLELILYRMSPWGEELPVMLWLHGRWAAFSDAWGTLGQNDGASLACAHVLMLVAVQHCLGILRLFISEQDANTTKNQHFGETGFEDQHLLMIWLQDSAAGLDLS